MSPLSSLDRELLSVNDQNRISDIQRSVVSLLSESISSCPLCESTRHSEYETLEHYGIRLTYLVCGNCGLVYQSPRIPETRVPEFYESQYRHLYLGQAAPCEQELQVQRKRASHLVDFLVKNKCIPTYHLDIGCGSGALLQATHSRFNCRVVGIELDEAHRAYAIENGLQVYHSLEAWRSNEIGLVDLVSLSHVLEHLTDPVTYLIRIRKDILGRDGYLLVEVPNLYFHPSLELAHTFALSLTTLRNVLHKAGFELVHHKSHSVPRSRLLPLYITVIAWPGEDTMQYPIKKDRYSRHRRKLGRRLISIEASVRRLWAAARRRYTRALAKLPIRLKL